MKILSVIFIISALVSTTAAAQSSANSTDGSIFLKVNMDLTPEDPIEIRALKSKLQKYQSDYLAAKRKCSMTGKKTCLEAKKVADATETMVNAIVAVDAAHSSGSIRDRAAIQPAREPAASK